METIHGWIGKQPRSYTLAMMLRIPYPSPWRSGKRVWGSDNRLLSVRLGHKEGAAVEGVGVRTVISPPLHGSGFILPPRPQHYLMSCILLVWAQSRRLFRALTLPDTVFYLV